MYDDFTDKELIEFYRQQSSHWHTEFLKTNKGGTAMKEAIERIIIEMELIAKRQFDEYNKQRWDPASSYHFGYAEGIDAVIDKLKAAIAQ
ncbi:hypothetical protein SD71_10670 [Cohnella kolymensis]|uniref:Phage protein n=1 Tax=Cohnella kolymensis TaxID=1590652 RepID=A0ABR5A470_9BACL|nr:hypothetical protein [Cohnella kolymensis]KIL35850.1 hypothetical protein SD71_10670 [Cohnella kolymensis]